MFFNFLDQKFIWRQQQNFLRILTQVIPIEKVDGSSMQWRGRKEIKIWSRFTDELM